MVSLVQQNFQFNFNSELKHMNQFDLNSLHKTLSAQSEENHSSVDTCTVKTLVSEEKATRNNPQSSQCL